MDTVWINAMQLCCLVVVTSLLATFFSWIPACDWNGFVRFFMTLAAVAFVVAVFCLGMDMVTAA